MKNGKPLGRSLIRKAVRHLETSDRARSGLIMKHGHCTMTPALDNLFHASASSIIGQQISARAARTLSFAVREIFPCGDSLRRPEVLRAVRGAI